jgi:DNA-binding CsgD family transcriptional regulator
VARRGVGGRGHLRGPAAGRRARPLPADQAAPRARAETGRIGARRPGRPGELTPTERRVAELAATGRSNKEIARALFVTVNTVEGHLSHAYAKLGIRSRAQLAHRFGAAAEPEQP